MTRDKIFFYILFVIIPLYFLQGWLFGRGSIVSQTIAAIWLIIDVFYLIKYIALGQMESIGRILLIFWGLQLVTWLLTARQLDNMGNPLGWAGTYSLFKNISIVLLSYFPFYILTYKNSINEKVLKRFAILALICLIGAFYICFNEMAYDNGTNEIANRGAYYLVVIIPLLGLFFDDIIEFVIYGAIAILALIGAKRGAIICASFELLLFFYYYFKKSFKKKSSSKLVWFVVAIFALFYLLKDIYLGNEYLQTRYAQTLGGDSSLRDEIYSFALSKFINQDLFCQLFGNGMSSTLRIIGGYAHQDWLELLINNGVIGIIVYALVFVVLFSFFRRKRNSLIPMEKFMFLSAIIGWFTRSMFSMGYMSVETSFYVIVFGFISAKQRTQQLSIK